MGENAKTLIAIPCMDMVHTGFMRSLLGLHHPGAVRYSLTMSSLIYDARNSLAKQAVTEGYDRVLWLDSDMDFAPDLMQRLSADLDEGRDMVSGLYFKRKAPVGPVVYEKLGHVEVEGGVKPFALPYDDYPRDTIFEVAGVGFGAVMMKTDLIKRVADKFGLPFSPILGFGEDLSFCARVTEVGAKMWCDSRVKVGHIGFGPITEEAYLAQRGAGQ